MKRQLIAFSGSLVMAAAVLAAQGTPAQTPAVPPDQPQQSVPETKEQQPAPDVKPQQPPSDMKPQQPPEIALTGCLIQGTGPTVFILDNAKASASDPAERAQAFVLAAGTEDLSFKAHLNHEVTVTGTTAAIKAMPPAGEKPAAKVDEKDLPRLTAKSVTMISDRCLSTSR